MSLFSVKWKYLLNPVRLDYYFLKYLKSLQILQVIAPSISVITKFSQYIHGTIPSSWQVIMDQVMQFVEPSRQFVKDSIRLVKRCTKPDRKGKAEHSPYFTLYLTVSLSVGDLFVRNVSQLPNMRFELEHWSSC